ncbi:UDP-N-acetylmuramate--L-alanine ligase [Qiania dongpingensis]|uniref:UDP-N-acetylmuramate--L-alanine ligase n=1 Tax=Qiania dongpingensis TaxID=2763669 RepID=A0A7G9G876_9FIRM|nr:UDP-N-acetylmuramate--L-alanine ligase [Qiania dongpingensis]QNM07008.1 UDP-N-acetylmuramate--L-alanine ligase [Qiania dongpingensis]
MYQIDFQKPIAVHFIGIGGISMSGLAEVLLARGFKVSGSDSAVTPLTEHLEQNGAAVCRGQRASNITDDIDLVVYTAAVHPDNPEYAEAVRRGLPILSRAELLGQMMKNYQDAVAISGTHGKTTTTSMVTEILLAADADPTISVGGILHSIGGNIRIGNSGCFVTEACEYTNSFHSFFPTIEVILNIREDHLDFFKDLDEIRESFHTFAKLLPEDGMLIINGDIPDYQKLTGGLSCPVVTFALENGEADYRAADISYDEAGHASFDVLFRGTKIAHIALEVPGEHNVANALAAVAVAKALHVPDEAIERGLDGYTGTERRFETKGVLGGVTVVDDYAHHPDEIRATLLTAKKLKKKKIWCVFQPHTYTRTKALLSQFADALSLADEVVLAKIYPARETDTLGISSADLAVELEKLGKKAHYFESFDEIENFLLENCVPGELLITMGAGDVVKIGENLLGL